MTFELEGEPERVIGAGEAFWEPGGDIIHYQAANHLQDAWTRFVVVMVGMPGKPMLTLVSEAELKQRRGQARTCAGLVPLSSSSAAALPVTLTVSH